MLVMAVGVSRAVMVLVVVIVVIVMVVVVLAAVVAAALAVALAVTAGVRLSSSGPGGGDDVGVCNRSKLSQAAPSRSCCWGRRPQAACLSVKRLKGGCMFLGSFLWFQPRAVCQLVESPSSMHFMSIDAAHVLGIA